MSKTWFVTGTDTGVGKTAVSCALLIAAADVGLRTAAVKPVVSRESVAVVASIVTEPVTFTWS